MELASTLASPSTALADTWQRSSRCANGGCVEVAKRGNEIAVRDSKVDGGPILTYNREEWQAFVEGVKAGEFDV